MKIIRLGHASYVLKSNSGNHYMIDPFLDANPGCPAQYVDPEFLKKIDAVCLTHGHFDHTEGLEELAKHNPDVKIIAQYDFGLILMQNGFKNVELINVGGKLRLDDVSITMVKANHTSSYQETVGTPIYAGTAVGYMFDFKEDITLYHSGDTAMMTDMELYQKFHQPDVAILSASGQFVMEPEEAAFVVKNLLDVKYVIPNHQFPNHETTPRKEVLEGMLANFPVIETMMDKDNVLEALLADYDKTEVVILDYGEEREFHMTEKTPER